MKLVKNYTTLDDVLLHLKEQVKDSLAFAQKIIPATNDPEELFYYLRSRVKYKSDPDGIELLQSLQTLVSGERTGTPWAGDCDCFTIVALSALLVNGLSPTYVILVGRHRDMPVHIYAGIDEGGKIVPFDLTNDDYGYERTNYKYQQILPFIL